MKINFKRLVTRKDVLAIVKSISEEPFSIRDVDGRPIQVGNTDVELGAYYPVRLEDDVIGWVSGGKKAQTVAALLSYLAALEYEKRALSRETLEKYKEITLLYNITEKLAASLNTKEVAHLVIEEIKKIIMADSYTVMIINGETGMLEILESSGKESAPMIGSGTGSGIAEDVILKGKAEIINDVLSEPRFAKGDMKVSSLMCAPLKIKDRVIGVIQISSAKPTQYTAEDLKMLSALALQAASAIENAVLYDKLKETFHTTVYTLAETIEKRDPYTGGHTKRVMDYSVEIGKQLGISAAQLEKLKLAAMLHDIGKIGISDKVLLKKGKLTDEEYAIIKKHSVYGEEVLNHIKDFNDIIPGIRSHHERFDGKGYPEGLKGDQIDLIARIIAVADTFDAMTSDRPYRKGLGSAVAIEELKRNAGTQFDPEVVEAFLYVLNEELIRYGDMK